MSRNQQGVRQTWPATLFYKVRFSFSQNLIGFRGIFYYFFLFFFAIFFYSMSPLVYFDLKFQLSWRFFYEDLSMLSNISSLVISVYIFLNIYQFVIIGYAYKNIPYLPNNDKYLSRQKIYVMIHSVILNTFLNHIIINNSFLQQICCYYKIFDWRWDNTFFISSFGVLHSRFL